MPLTDTALRNAKAADADFQLRDGGGLYLLVKKTGANSAPLLGSSQFSSPANHY